MLKDKEESIPVLEGKSVEGSHATYHLKKAQAVISVADSEGRGLTPMRRRSSVVTLTGRRKPVTAANCASRSRASRSPRRPAPAAASALPSWAQASISSTTPL